ncbi:trk system potassium uptake protein TrkA [Rhodovulum sp. ES.010]|uniref:potassium channel family protein n=1 Tax=Rhodovulum sp. ES.010 TaxID=1882821 RepID=UPI0009260F40|nr:NAD-binding protein [Rhodovulum sp. ES.010]SIO47570.1 trk system potassium uptake protein TrkA [Rhodovulum sp. ES.010]
MRVVILGASRFGETIAEYLIGADHEVVLIDKDRTRLEKLAERLDCGMIEGDGTMPTVLREAFRDENDVFIAVTNASDDNILASVVARSVGFGRVIPQITASELIDVCHELDLNDLINPHATVAENICAGLVDQTAIDEETALRNQLALKRVYVPERMAGARFGDIETPEEARVVALIRDEDEMFATEESELREGDYLLFVVDRDMLDALSDAFAA